MSIRRRTGATVLTSDLYPQRHATAAKFGLVHPLDARGDVVAATKAATEGRGADVERQIKMRLLAGQVTHHLIQHGPEARRVAA